MNSVYFKFDMTVKKNQLIKFDCDLEENTHWTVNSPCPPPSFSQSSSRNNWITVSLTLSYRYVLRIVTELLPMRWINHREMIYDDENVNNLVECNAIKSAVKNWSSLNWITHIDNQYQSWGSNWAVPAHHNNSPNWIIFIPFCRSQKIKIPMFFSFLVQIVFNIRKRVLKSVRAR